MRPCDVPRCANPKSNTNVDMRYGKYAICGDCLDKAVDCYIRLKKDLSYIE